MRIAPMMSNEATNARGGERGGGGSAKPKRKGVKCVESMNYHMSIPNKDQIKLQHNILYFRSHILSESQTSRTCDLGTTRNSMLCVPR